MVAKNILLTLVVGLAAGWGFWDRTPMPWTPLRYLSLAVALTAFIMWTAARFQLGNSLTVSAQAKQLVNSGVYSKIRNPIYAFASLFIAGYLLLLNRPKWLLILALIIPLQIWRVRKEAQVLEDRFGDQYRQYRANTWF